MFETRTEPMLLRARFIRRMMKFVAVAAIVDVLVVVLGAIGFHVTSRLEWLDAFVDAAMVITGNGTRSVIETSSGQLFLMGYALVGAAAYIVVVALVLAPALHRLLHAFHLRAPEDSESKEVTEQDV